MADGPLTFPGRDASGRWKADGAAWTPERVERLLALAAEGLSGALIAAELGITRNAVAGKLSRLRGRLKVDTETREVRKPKRTARKRRSPPVKSAPELEIDDAPTLEPEPLPAHMDEPLPSSRLIRNGKQLAHHCRWPLGDPRTPEFRWCGADREHDRTMYCATHHSLACN